MKNSQEKCLVCIKESGKDGLVGKSSTVADDFHYMQSHYEQLHHLNDRLAAGGQSITHSVSGRGRGLLPPCHPSFKQRTIYPAIQQPTIHPAIHPSTSTPCNAFFMASFHLALDTEPKMG